jgi:hypothetical protein
MLRDALLAPAPDPRHVQLRQACLRHPDSLPAILPWTTTAASGLLVIFMMTVSRCSVRA